MFNAHSQFRPSTIKDKGLRYAMDYFLNMLQDVAHNIVRYCVPRLFTLPLGGVTVLLMDFVHAITSILVESGSQNSSQVSTRSKSRIFSSPLF